MIRGLPFIVCLLCVLGCSNKLKVTYYSDPTGAKFYDYGHYIGTAPITLNYEPTQEFKNGECMFLKSLTARWVSGAENSLTSIKACASEGKKQNLTFFRPKNVPGVEVDAQFASQYEYQQEMQKKRDDESTQQAIRNLNSISNSLSGTSNYRGSSGGYQTKDMNGVLVNSNDCYQTKDSLGVIVNSAGCGR
jgi:hypothetical protein